MFSLMHSSLTEICPHVSKALLQVPPVQQPRGVSTRDAEDGDSHSRQVVGSLYSRNWAREWVVWTSRQGECADSSGAGVQGSETGACQSPGKEGKWAGGISLKKRSKTKQRSLGMGSLNSRVELRNPHIPLSLHQSSSPSQTACPAL